MTICVRLLRRSGTEGRTNIIDHFYMAYSISRRRAYVVLGSQLLPWHWSSCLEQLTGKHQNKSFRDNAQLTNVAKHLNGCLFSC